MYFGGFLINISRSYLSHTMHFLSLDRATYDRSYTIQIYVCETKYLSAILSFEFSAYYNYGYMMWSNIWDKTLGAPGGMLNKRKTWPAFMVCIEVYLLIHNYEPADILMTIIIIQYISTDKGNIQVKVWVSCILNVEMIFVVISIVLPSLDCNVFTTIFFAG